MAKPVGQWEYRVIFSGSASKFARKVAEAEGEGFELVDFRTGGNMLSYHFVALVRRRRDGQSAP